ncbi:hypothetical protein A11A3_09155 [Alcanivorax hongdengensis A-11-3]|uniref:Inositolphosphotransferase Aur1/Ipt1 domain-containing protein n=1 Tax=Alcanivorax hongdengensis A-11-3 TaxID=1177179 RepID=L0WBL6_9GAMM|nr:phosphatase PAP2 family protein [Alcanivorax hongdengensis]EKF74356.1 hypothetical protein A11A3_09155 [Alcanivorax hongdengensis A-11-3]
MTSSPEEQRPLLERCAAGVWRGLGRDAGIYLLVSGYIVITVLAAGLTGHLPHYSLMVYPQTTIQVSIVLGLFMVVGYGGYVMLYRRPSFPLRYLAGQIRRFVVSAAFFRGLFLLLVFTLFFSAVSSSKSLIGVWQPFAWDARFAHWDAWLHGGKMPWQWLQPVLGYPWITTAINAVYNLWFMVMFAVFYWQLFSSRDERRRQRFLISFIGCWAVNGTLLAVLFSSAGPCFFHYLLPDGPDPFAPLMRYLHAAQRVSPVWALSTQDMLWQYHQAGALGVGTGISAMPSMHVSIAWLMVLLTAGSPLILRYFLRAFFVVILLGSVHLGWHYAIDGYFSVLTTTLIWSVTAWIGRPAHE